MPHIEIENNPVLVKHSPWKFQRPVISGGWSRRGALHLLPSLSISRFFSTSRGEFFYEDSEYIDELARIWTIKFKLFYLSLSLTIRWTGASRWKHIPYIQIVRAFPDQHPPIVEPPEIAEAIRLLDAADIPYSENASFYPTLEISIISLGNRETISTIKTLSKSIDDGDLQKLLNLPKK